ncbi:hypothetical protein BC830DRAFT_1152200 [Chytriomyces sp. MP71]|nr:hypothetical protein BC830DRAFT_1152200 [Chytriomyces sp. MP71]
MAVALNGDSPITSTTPSTRSSQIIQLFIQITLTIRSLLSSAPESTQAQLVLPIYKSGDRCTLELLFSMMGDNEVFMDSDELILNVARILSKSSLNSTCLSKMHGQQAIDHFMTVILKFQAEKQTPQPHLLRLLFVLGNLSTPTYDLAPAEEDPTLADLQALARHTCDLVALFAVYTRKVLRKWRRDGGEHGLEVSDEEADAESRVEAGRKVQERKGLDDRNDAGDEEVLVKVMFLSRVIDQCLTFDRL